MAAAVRKRFFTAIGRAARLVNSEVARVIGRPINPDPLVRLLGARMFLWRYYGAFIDAHGASFGDVDDIVGRLRSANPAAWAAAWRGRAEHYERLGRSAHEEGRQATAASLLITASTFYRIAEIALLEESALRKELGRRMVETFLLGGECQDPPVERVRIPVGQDETAAYLRVPRAGHPPPVIIIIPGLGMLKEHGDFPQEPFLERGMAALTMDLPGQGENRGRFTMSPASAQRLISAAMDYLQGRSDVDGSRIGILGTSMGAVAAMYACAEDHRPRALVELAGFYYPLKWWNYFLADGIKDFLRFVAGVSSDDELLSLVGSINLRGVVGNITCPVLVVHGERDNIVPVSEADLIFEDAVDPKERLVFPTGDHGCVNVGEARPLIADWLYSQLGCGHAVGGAEGSGTLEVPELSPRP